jgi:hypothetical protein
VLKRVAGAAALAAAISTRSGAETSANCVGDPNGGSARTTIVGSRLAVDASAQPARVGQDPPGSERAAQGPCVLTHNAPGGRQAC